jgi:hypothetical protein
MKLLPKVQINPTSRVATLLHMIYLLLLPLLMLVLVRAKFVEAAVAVIILSKWRMFSVRPRYWVANVRANLVDIVVGVSVVVFMAHSTRVQWLLVWAALYSMWLLFIKPRSDNASIGLQAFISQGLGLTALFNNYSATPQVLIVFTTWLICFGAARHFLATSEDETNRPLAHLWAVFASEMGLILGHWNIVYGGFLPQVVLIISTIGYTLGVGYYIHRTRGINSGLRKQLMAITVVVLLMVVVLSDWQSKTF